MTTPTPSRIGAPPAPVLIAVIAIVILFALNLWMFWEGGLFGALGSLPATTVAPILGQLALIIASIIGLWQMKKWGAVCYFINVGINLVVLLPSGTVNPIGLVLPAAIIVLILTKFKEMD